MKRSEAIKKLIPKVISKFQVISKENYDNGVYEARAEELLDFIEKELGMVPPDQNKDIEPPCAVMTYWEDEGET